jgi:hypothetical protein
MNVRGNKCVMIWGENNDVTFKVDLKCRTEQAPVELLVELLKEQSYEDNEEESAPGAHREQGPSPEFELKLEIETGGNRCRHRTTVDRYLIRHRHTEKSGSQWGQQKRTLY